ncbi:MAG TPA: zinc ABC transporter substrate-binding protein [Bacteroidales bacterium]|nr:zinc ABC transporter substrate-binding protein [Bacteroidales bacterium]
MKKALCFFLLTLIVSCNNQTKKASADRIVTVSIAPFKYFIDRISDGDFVVNVMVPPGSDPHVYEPVPDQINKLRYSEAYISNGFLGFEMVWLDRLYEVNKGMKKLNLGDHINPILSEHSDSHKHTEGADPHYWVSPICAIKISEAIKLLLTELNPADSVKYENNCNILISEIQALIDKGNNSFSDRKSRTFMIYHPNLAYIARDFGLTEIAVETEGKEPSPSDLRNLIDSARKENITTIFVQKEFDRRNAQAIADEIGADLTIIDPLSEDWKNFVNSIIEALSQSFKN